MTGGFYVYELIDPRTGAVFYVGKGVRGRIDQHERDARAGVESRKCDVIRAIEADGLRIVKKRVRSFADEQEAYDFEAEHIDTIGLENLTNVVAGGGAARTATPISKDRDDAEGIADLANRTKGFTVPGVYVLHKFMDFAPIYEAVHRKAAEIIDRRGADWFERVTRKYGVRFVENG